MPLHKSVHDDVLGRVEVAAPCWASWDAMPGGERVRSCEACQHKVYNLSALSRREAEKLVRGAENKQRRLCIRFYRRSDGTILTRDCPRGLRAVRKRVARAVSCAFASLLFVGGGWTQAGRLRARAQVQQLRERIDPPASPAKGLSPRMGAMPLPMAPRSSFDEVPPGIPTASETPPTPRPEGVTVGRLARPMRPDPFVPVHKGKEGAAR